MSNIVIQLVDRLAHLPSRKDLAMKHKQRGGAVAAVLPIYFPRALLRAFDIHPIEVWGPPGVDPTSGSAHLQPYVCSIVRNALSFLESGGLDVVDFIVIPHACDSLQGLGSILIDFVQPGQEVLTMYLPRGDKEIGVSYLAEEFEDIFRRLSGSTGRSMSKQDLMKCIYREEEADELLGRLHDRRPDLPLSDLEFYRLIRSREFLPVEGFIELADIALHLPAREIDAGIPILLSGIIPEPFELLSVVRELGGQVVADDTACCGRRVYPPGESLDPFTRMAQRLLNTPPDWTKGNPISDRLEHLLAMIERSDARGVLFYNIKFCEPELFDLPNLRNELRRSGIPSVVIEVDMNDPLSNQVITRLEAFMEILQ
jgi:benzoyl-CoA reductase/2-hydroxyglutaryl-CoA dehydratase subunit BcrC/BadD/HgdB